MARDSSASGATGGWAATGAAAAELGLQADEWRLLLDRTEGFSGSDLADLVRNAMYQPIRETTTARHWVLSDSGAGRHATCVHYRVLGLRARVGGGVSFGVLTRSLSTSCYFAGKVWLPCASNTAGAVRQNLQDFPPQSVGIIDQTLTGTLPHSSSFCRPEASSQLA